MVRLHSRDEIVAAVETYFSRFGITPFARLGSFSPRILLQVGASLFLATIFFQPVDKR